MIKEHDGGVIVGVTPVGQGKRTFELSVRPYLKKKSLSPKVIEPSQGDRRTRATWWAINEIYKATGQPGVLQDVYSRIRSEADEGSLTRLANRELLEYLSDQNKPFLTFHGLYGKGAQERFFAEGDVWPERLAADEQTTVFVPLEQTRKTLGKFGENKKIEVVGFMIPKELHENQRSEARIQARIDKFTAGELDKDHPLRLAYMTTGQFAHMGQLENNVFGDPKVADWMREKKVDLDIYLWNGKAQAKKIYRLAKEKGLEAHIVNEYQPDLHGVQIYWNEDPNTAVDTSFKIAREADILISPLGERVAWTIIPTVPLPPVGGNLKMIHNTRWAQGRGLVGTYMGPADATDEIKDLGRTIESFLAKGGSRAKWHQDTAQTLFEAGIFDGSPNIAKHMRSVVDKAAMS